ncbi:MAG: hypothetical protein WKG32_17750, partial [Gemmatimonadaceae bacterium]
LTLAQDGTTLTGQMVSERGTLEITDGRVSGKSVSWTVVMPMGGQSVTITFQGQVEGERNERMTGSAALGPMGSATFTAEKRP